MLEWEKAMYDKVGPKVCEAFRKRNFDAYYCSTKEEAVEKIVELIPKGGSVSWGGSQTLNQIGIKERLYKEGYVMLDRDKTTGAEREEIMRKAFFSDTFLMSSNAITEEGELFNIDGNGNRIAALCFGPKSVIVVCGLNKLTPNMEAAISRARHLAAPMNSQRFPDSPCPCFYTGECIDCTGEGSHCAYMLETRVSRPKHKIKVILIGENLGF